MGGTGRRTSSTLGGTGEGPGTWRSTSCPGFWEDGVDVRGEHRARNCFVGTVGLPPIVIFACLSQ
jgi:hypothetical protein